MLCKMLGVTWGKVTTKTDVNCFEKAGISKDKRCEALLDADCPSKDLQEQLVSLPYTTPSSFQEEPPLIISSLWMILSPALSH